MYLWGYLAGPRCTGDEAVRAGLAWPHFYTLNHLAMLLEQEEKSVHIPTLLWAWRHRCCCLGGDSCWLSRLLEDVTDKQDKTMLTKQRAPCLGRTTTSLHRPLEIGAIKQAFWFKAKINSLGLYLGIKTRNDCRIIYLIPWLSNYFLKI